MNLPNLKSSLYTYLIEQRTEIDYDVYLYGYTAFINYLYYVMITFPIAFILGKVMEVLTFLFFFIPLRRYIGGYHFGSKKLCLIFSVLFSFFIPYLAIWSGNINLYIRILIIIIMVNLTIKIKAVDHPNKRISPSEKSIYTKKSLVIETLYSLGILILYNDFTYMYLNIAFFSMIFCVSGTLIAKLKD